MKVYVNTIIFLRLILVSFFVLLMSVVFQVQSAALADSLSSTIVEEIIGAAFDGVDQETQRRRAAAATLAQLDAMGDPDLALVVPTDALRDHVLKALAGDLGDTELTVNAINFENGGLGFAIEGRYQDDPLVIEAAVTGMLTAAVEGDSLVLLPSFSTIEVTNVEFGDGIETAIAEEAARRLLPLFPEQAAAALTAAIPPVPLDFDPLTFDIGKELRALDQVESASGPEVSLSLKPGAAAILIEEHRLVMLALLGPSPKELGAVESSSFEEAQERTEILLFDLAGHTIDAGGVAVRRQAVAKSLNALLSQAQPVASARLRPLAPHPVTFSEKVELAGRPNFSCGPIRDCTPRMDCTQREECRPTRNCSSRRDTRDCRACIVPNPFGGCSLRGNDPTCEARKAANNTRFAAEKAACEAAKVSDKANCEAGKASRKAACEAEKTGRRLACETEKSSEVAQCETRKFTQNILAEAGGVGNISGDFDVTYDMHVDLTSLAFAPDLNATAQAQLAGQAELAGELSFVPYDVLGHLACTSKWTRHLNVGVSLPPTHATATVRLTTRTGEPVMQLAMPEQTLYPRSRPPLNMMFEQHPELRVICPGLHVIDLADDAVRAVSGDNINNALGGEYEIPIDAIDITETVSPIDITLGDTLYSFLPEFGDHSLLFRLAL